MFRPIFALVLAALPLALLAEPAQEWESIDPDLDIMALIDDEPEGVSMIQKDSRLQHGGSRDAPCLPGSCGVDEMDLVVPFEEEEGVSFVQVSARYKLNQRVAM